MLAGFVLEPGSSLIPLLEPNEIPFRTASPVFMHDVALNYSVLCLSYSSRTYSQPPWHCSPPKSIIIGSPEDEQEGTEVNASVQARYLTSHPAAAASTIEIFVNRRVRGLCHPLIPSFQSSLS